MKKIAVVLALAVAAIALPARAQTPEEMLSDLASALNLTPAQRETMRNTISQFLQKQDQVPLVGTVISDNRAMLKQIITSPTFDPALAQSFVQKITGVIQEATLNRLQLRHDLYQQLTPEQQQQYLELVQSRIGGLLQ